MRRGFFLMRARCVGFFEIGGGVMKIVSNRFVPFPGFKAVNLLGVMFVRRGFPVTEVDIRHEQIPSDA